MSAFSAAAQDEDGDIISALRARVADLEAQLYAVGAGGVGKLEQLQSVTNCHQSQPQGEPPGSTESAYQRGYLDGMAKGRRDAAMDAEEGQEPVAYYVMNGAALFQLFRSKSQADALAYDLQKRHDLSGSLAHFHVVPLYIRPHPPRQPLTDEQQIAEAMRRHGLVLVKTINGYDVLKLGQITAHGIGGEA